MDRVDGGDDLVRDFGAQLLTTRRTVLIPKWSEQ